MVFLSDLKVLQKIFITENYPIVIYDSDGVLHRDMDFDELVVKDLASIPKDSPSILFNLCARSLFKVYEETACLKAYYDFNNDVLQGDLRRYLFINNPNKTIRWIYPQTAKHPIFLQFYNANTWKARLIKQSFKVGFSLGLQQLMSSGGFSFHSKQSNRITQLMTQETADDYAIFMGTVGDNRKAIIALNENKQTKAFVKIPITNTASKLIQNEYQQLKDLNTFSFEQVVLPSVTFLESLQSIVLSNIKPKNPKTAHELNDLHFSFLKQLYHHKTEKKIGDLASYHVIQSNLKYLKKIQHTGDLDKAKVDKVVQYLIQLNAGISADSVIDCSLAHGDFTPWNMYHNEHQLYIYDWELSQSEMPLFYDLFHFVFQTHILIHRSPHAKIQEVLDIASKKAKAHQLKIESVYYHYYLLFTISYYLPLYIQQSPLHEQAHWLLDNWLQALEEVAVEQL